MKKLIFILFTLSTFVAKAQYQTKIYRDSISSKSTRVLEHFYFGADEIYLPTHTFGRNLQLKFLADPTENQDAVTLAYLNTVIGGDVTDATFQIKNAIDLTKIFKVDVSGVTTGTTRTLTIPDKNGTFALLDDLHAPVTLGGTLDYLTLSGQEITPGFVDLTTDVTGILPDANVANNITLDNITQITNRSHTNLSDIGTNTHVQIDSHIASTANPHTVTLAQATTAGASTTNDITIGDVLNIGDGTTGVNKQVFANNGDINKPGLRYNEIDNSWEFSNDGTTFTDFGAGDNIYTADGSLTGVRNVGLNSNVLNFNDISNSGRVAYTLSDAAEVLNTESFLSAGGFEITTDRNPFNCSFNLSHLEILLNSHKFLSGNNLTSTITLKGDTIELFNREGPTIEEVIKTVRTHEQIRTIHNSNFGEPSNVERGFIFDENGIRYDNVEQTGWVNETLVTKAYVDAQAGGGGDVVGPASSTTNAIATFANATGKLIKNNDVTLSSASNLATFATTTSDAADNMQINFASGGAAMTSRGAYMNFRGNEFSSLPGLVEILAGNVPTGMIDFYTQGTKRLSLDYSGNLDLISGDYQLNGTSINTAGTLSNVAYLNQANTFTLDQTVPTETYSSSWQNSAETPTKGDLYDKIESLAVGGVISVTSTTTNQLTSSPTTGAVQLAIQTANVTDAGMSLATGDQIHDFVTTQGYLTSEVDGDVSNEGSLTVGAGTATTSLIQSNTAGSTDVTFEAGSNITLSEAANTITISAFGGSSDQIVITDIQNSSNSSYSGGNVILNGQSFVLSSQSDINSIEVHAAGVQGSPDLNVRLGIYSVSGGLPQTLLHQSTNTFTAASFTTSEYKEFLFSSVNLAAGTYAFVLNYENVVLHNGTNRFDIESSNQNPYAEGSLVQKIGAGAWAEVSGWDVRSRINITSGGGNVVTSFNTRVGDVVPQSGDYTSDQVTEGITNLYNQVPAGGTANQVLSKIDATDYNLQWVDQSGSTSPLTTKGDLYTYSTADARLPVGTNGQFLTANSATATGLEWNTTLPIANGGTGQTTQTAAFDALAPTTTQGDISYHNGTDNVRLAKGTAGQVLTMNSGATAPEWADAGGGGASLLDLVGYQKGGWGASNSSTNVDSWGCLALTVAQDAGSIRSFDGAGQYLRQNHNGVLDNSLGIIGHGQINAFMVQQRPLFMFKVRKGASAFNYSIKMGLTSSVSNEVTSSISFVGLKRNSSGNMLFSTSNGTAETTTDTGQTLADADGEVTILVCEVKSATEVNFWLYDETYTLLSSATHTTNIPALSTELAFACIYFDKTGSTTNYFYQYSANIILR